MASIPTLIGELQRFCDAFDFTTPGLADEIAEAAAAGIAVNMDAEQDPDGNAWPALSPAYEAWKSAHFPGQEMAVLRGAMKTAQQLKGEVVATPGEIKQTYGVDPQARQEATQFQEGDANQPPRPFYAFSNVAVMLVDQVLDRRFDVVVPP